MTVLSTRRAKVGCSHFTVTRRTDGTARVVVRDAYSAKVFADFKTTARALDRVAKVIASRRAWSYTEVDLNDDFRFVAESRARGARYRTFALYTRYSSGYASSWMAHTSGAVFWNEELYAGLVRVTAPPTATTKRGRRS